MTKPGFVSIALKINQACFSSGSSGSSSGASRQPAPDSTVVSSSAFGWKRGTEVLQGRKRVHSASTLTFPRMGSSPAATTQRQAGTAGGKSERMRRKQKGQQKQKQACCCAGLHEAGQPASRAGFEQPAGALL